ncbi:MAG: hypothetical protein A3F89_04315 [Deltaproteobacteria bacterium RIFCSPLOWO2_12_FULL_50_11]|nr:MAG: hypothetical protein A3F89_04315 [Deltaproteobacteria bacterium RIFCSPLOWO2_12_FULL_50_11]
MKTTLVYWHKARIHDRYVLEMEIFKVAKSTKCPDGVRYGLIFTDLRTGKQVLMDNHHPKGPHIHLDDDELPYDYVDEEKLIQDFKDLVLANMEVRI